MNRHKYHLLRKLITTFVSVTVAMAVIRNSYLLAIAGVATGMVFLAFVRTKANIKVDEREKAVREKAANFTYAIFTPTLAIGSFILLVPFQKISPVFANGEFVYLESLGQILAYLTLFLIAIYAISYHYLNRKFGGSGDEE